MARSSSGKRLRGARSGAFLTRKQIKEKSPDGDRRMTVEDGDAFGRAEQSLITLLAEPEIRMLMQADRVDVQNLMTELNAISALLRKKTLAIAGNKAESAQKPHRTASNDKSYRAGVGIILLNRQGQVFVAQRVDVKGEAWQMPQGGINHGERAREAALRELREEIGTDDADVIAESKEWFYYDVPPDIARNAWGGKWRGQRQKWFVMIFKGQDSDIGLATEQPEFNAWRWISPQQLSALAVSFKRQLYLDLMGEFATIFRD
jgi:putative (di)nucleoside polyphosphate hydrolase